MKRQIEQKKARFFSHKECEYFPCHETDHPEEFNCLFCYCPLYALGERCGGHFSYTSGGVKSCIKCGIPHEKDGYTYILAKLPEIVALARARDGS